MASLIDNSSSSTSQTHSTLYFPTGDVIIRAIAKNINEPSVTHLFRVHTFMLAHHSPVLADMFTLPVTSNANEQLDGVPVIDFPDDAKDVEGLLKVFYNPEYVLYFPRMYQFPLSLHRVPQSSPFQEVRPVYAHPDGRDP